MAFYENLLFWGLTCDFIGKVLTISIVMLVHRRILKEGKLDKYVLKEMKLEQTVTIFAIIFLILGYILNISA